MPNATESLPQTMCDQQYFQHRPLDPSKKSIRVIRIRPKLSVDGLITCDVRHATITSRYQCLSYRWGSCDKTKTVLLRDPASQSGKTMPLRVGDSLYEFLEIARRKTWLCKMFWIDALCIDQNNQKERSHQVAHMGHIFAHARRVIVWLGRTSSTYYRSMSATARARWRSFVLKNEYWSRAWITQEVVLARSVSVLINDSIISLRKLVDRLSEGLPQDWLCSPTRVLINTGLVLRYGDTKPRLLDLLQEGAWADKQCSVPRDRVFSILELVQEGRNIDVDYESAPLDLACNILNACGDIPCPCAVYALLRALEVDDLTGIRAVSESFLENDMSTPFIRLGSDSHPYCNMRHSHQHRQFPPTDHWPGMASRTEALGPCNDDASVCQHVVRSFYTLIKSHQIPCGWLCRK